VSYAHQVVQVDLTKVESGSEPPRHEIEVEFIDTQELLAEGAKEERGETSIYYEMVSVMLNTVRMSVSSSFRIWLN
jgi:hypothetical protein